MPDTRPISATRREVWRAVLAELRKQGFSGQHLPAIEGLDLPAALPTLDGLSLRVTSACWDALPRRTQMRMECGAPGQCLPFLIYFRDVYLHDDPSENPGNDHGDDLHSTVSNASAPLESCRMASHPAREALLKPVVRAGDKATAVFHADRLRMTASVTCLERGREGEVIRVRGPDGHVFHARISGPDQLEALPQ